MPSTAYLSSLLLLLATAAIGSVTPVAAAAGPDILFVTDHPCSPMGDSLQRLYPGRVRVVCLATESCPKSAPAEVHYLVAAITDPAQVERLDSALMADFAKKGRTVITGLDEYARHRGAAVNRQPVRAQYRAIDPASFREAWQIRSNPPAPYRLLQEDRTTNKPGLRLIALRDWTRGFHEGDEVPWFGLLDPAAKYRPTQREQLYTAEVEYRKWQRLRLDVSLENRLWKEWEERAERWYYQLRIARLPKDFHGVVVGRSSIDGQPLLIEEPWGEGRWIALDLVAPEEPMFHPHFGEGSFNKYVFVGNLCGRTVEHGRFWTRWPTPEEVNRWMQQFARRNPAWTAIREVVYHYDPQGIEHQRNLLGLPPGLLQSRYENYSLNLGDRRRPIWLLVGGTHGPEGISTLGLLSLAESLNERLGRDADLQQFLEHYCLKLYPLNNPLNYTSLIYRDPWDGPGWRMENVNPESAGYRFFMGHDIHGNPGSIAGIQQGNGRWIEAAVARCNRLFRDRYLEAEPDGQYGTFTGFANPVGEMRPRVRRCIYPECTFRTYSMGSEMPDNRMGIFGGDSVQLHFGEGKSYNLNRGKLWPMQSYFTLQVTDVIASYLYQEMMPHPWTSSAIPSPDPDYDIRLWRYHPAQRSGTMIATFRLKNRPRATDFEYLDLVEVSAESPRVERHPLDGRLHCRGLMYSYPVEVKPGAEDSDWREENQGGPTFLRWHWLRDADAFRPLVARHWALYGQQGNRPAVYLDQPDSEGVYQVRREAPASAATPVSPFAGKTFAYYRGRSGHQGWADLSADGFSAMATRVQADAGRVRSVGADEPLANVDLLVMGNLTEADVEEATLKRIVHYVDAGGRLLVVFPDLLYPYPRDSGEGKRQGWMRRDGECDWEFHERQSCWDPTPLFEKRLAAYRRFCDALGVRVHPQVASNYRRVHGDWCWIEPFFGHKAGFADYTGLDIVKPHDGLMWQGFRLMPLVPSLQPLLSLHGKTIIAGGRRGKGWLLVSGGGDLFRNRAISEKIHEPADWEQSALPPAAPNIEVRDRLLAALLRGLADLKPCPPERSSPESRISLERLPEELHVSWPGADGGTRHFTIRDCPSAGTPGLAPRVQLGLGDRPRMVEFRAIPHIMHRTRAEFEVRHEKDLEIILRAKHEFLPRVADVFEQYVFRFIAGRDAFQLKYRLEPLHVTRAFGRGVPEFRAIGDPEAWRDTHDPKRTWQVFRSAEGSFAFVISRGGTMLRGFDGSRPAEFEIEVLCGGDEMEQRFQSVRSASPERR